MQGWALKGQKAATRTSENVKAFLIAKFNEVQISDQKANLTGVAKEMQEAKDSRGSPVFLLEDWKTARKISNSYFLSRVSALNKSTRAVMVTLNDEQNLNNADFRSWEGYSAVESLRKEVYGAVKSFTYDQWDHQRKMTFINAIEELVHSCSCSKPR